MTFLRIWNGGRIATTKHNHRTKGAFGKPKVMIGPYGPEFKADKYSKDGSVYYRRLIK